MATTTTPPMKPYNRSDWVWCARVSTGALVGTSVVASVGVAVISGEFGVDVVTDDVVVSVTVVVVCIEIMVGCAVGTPVGDTVGRSVSGAGVVVDG